MNTEQKLKEYLKAIEKDDKKGKQINAFLQINPAALEDAKKIDEKIKQKKAGRLAGKIIAVKSCINVLGLNLSCASKTLENYKSTYDASVIEKIKAEDGLIIGMTNMDEFACGASGQNSAFGATKSPAALDRVAGGSSSGSAAAVAAGFCDMALGSDTGGSIRAPSSFCGVVGIKPSYGLVSRYGLIDMCMSFDCIGAIAKNTEDAALLLDVIKGRDERDATTFESENIKLEKIKKIVIGIPKLKLGEKKIWDLILEKVKDSGFIVKEIDIKHIDLGVQTYYPIVFTEFFSGTRKFDGRRYGKKIEEVCGEEVLRRILGGKEITKAEFAGRYYRKALSAKKLIADEFEKAFKEVDVIITPTMPLLPWGFDKKLSVEEEYAADALTCLANIAGIPAVSIPAGKIEGLPVGMQILGKRFNENKILSLAREFEEK
jgi:aspartyl-tRNA(Asn)/glutamyl-tRNA(Gln) amidotransferase subunit A